MKAKILLDYHCDVHKEAEEAKYLFLRDLLEKMEIPVNEFWNSNDLTIEQKFQLKKILTSYSIEVYDDMDGHMQVYANKQLIGEFHKSTYKLRRDLREIDPKKQLYVTLFIPLRMMDVN